MSFTKSKKDNPNPINENVLEVNQTENEDDNKLQEIEKTPKKNWRQLINPWHKSKGIRTQLLTTILPVVLIPLSVASIVGYKIVQDREENRLLTQMKNQILLTGEIVDNILVQSLNIPKILASDPFIINEAKKASQQVASEKLNTLSIPQLEQKFAKTKLLTPNQNINNYLSTLDSTQKMEIFFTDKNGYNIGYNSPTSDFVQRDEPWWQEGKKNDLWVSSPIFDESLNSFSIDVAKRITDLKTGEFLGIIKTVIPNTRFDDLEVFLEHAGLTGSKQIQLMDVKSGKSILTISANGAVDTQEIIGSEAIVEIGQLILKTLKEDGNLKTKFGELEKKYSLQNLEFPEVEYREKKDKDNKEDKKEIITSFLYKDKMYFINKIPNQEWLAVASINSSEIKGAGVQLNQLFLLMTMILGAISTITILLLSQRLSDPLKTLSDTAEKSSQGDLQKVTIPQGTSEMQMLADNYNGLIDRVQLLLQEEIESLEVVETSKQELEKLAEEQKEKNEAIQQELLSLLMDVEGASSGDLTVRAQISAGEIGIVADFFNSIVESLRDVVTQVKQTTLDVNLALEKDENAVQGIAKEAIKQSKKIERMLDFVEDMTKSIQEVANNTQTVAKVAQKASTTAAKGGITIDKTVKSIIQLRETIGETSKKVKRLGESSQQISKVISLINQIALQTNLLAINASIEAARAGEEGRGFAVVAEEVGQLAAQSSEATKEIEQIVDNIQKETSEVVEAMEEGTSQVVQGSKLVAQARKNFGEIVTVSREIDQLLQSISGATGSQTTTSEMVSNLMKDLVKVSQQSSNSSKKVSTSLQKTVQTARQLQESVETFKVSEEEIDNL